MNKLSSVIFLCNSTKRYWKYFLNYASIDKLKWNYFVVVCLFVTLRCIITYFIIYKERGVNNDEKGKPITHLQGVNVIRVHYWVRSTVEGYSSAVKSKISLLSCIFGPYKLLCCILHFFHALHLDVPYTLFQRFLLSIFFYFFFLPSDRTYVTVLTKFTQDLLQIRKRFPTRKTPCQLNLTFEQTPMCC